jgi:two-component system NarL family sensor kinase
VLALVENAHVGPVSGRFDDVEAELRELHQELRDLAHSLEPRSLLQQPLPEAVAHELAAFARRTGVATSVELEGAFDDTTPSQRIALLRVLQEALANVRQHSGAANVAVELRRTADGGICMEVRDDGRGLEHAAPAPDDGSQRGLGFVGMRERLRLLGGRLELSDGSSGTRVVALLPHWSPAR